MSWDDCEMPEFYEDSWHVARKSHLCDECYTRIKPGEKYLTCRGKWDGEFQVFKQHEECLAACLAARHWMKDQCVPFGGLLEWYGEWGHEKRHWPKKLRSALAKVLLRRRREFVCGRIKRRAHAANHNTV